MLVFEREALLRALEKVLPEVPLERLEMVVARLAGEVSEWEEVSPAGGEMGVAFSIQCPDICEVAYDLKHRMGRYRVLRRSQQLSRQSHG